MAKSKDAKKNVKKAPVKTAKEKKEEKRLKKSKQRGTYPNFIHLTIFNKSLNKGWHSSYIVDNAFCVATGGNSINVKTGKE